MLFFKRSRRSLSDQTGQGIIELVVSVSILAVCLLAAMQLSNSMMNNTLTAASSLGISEKLLEINGLLTNEVSCRLAFGGPTAYNSVADSTLNPKIDMSSPQIVIYQPITSSRTTAKQVLQANQPIHGGGTVTSVTLTPLNAADLAQPGAAIPVPVRLTIISSQNRGPTKVNRTVSDITFTAVLNANHYLVSCGSLSYSTSSTDTNAFSVPVQICPANMMLTSDGVHVRCVLYKCPAPTTFWGFSSDGGVGCRGHSP